MKDPTEVRMENSVYDFFIELPSVGFFISYPFYIFYLHFLRWIVLVEE